MAAGDGIYATKLEFEAYVEGWVTTDNPALERLLARAELDVDNRVVGPWEVEANGRKFGAPKTTNEKGLEQWQKDALSRATCAQAEYRHVMGEEFFVKGQYAQQSAPGFSAQGKLPYIGPKVWAELEGTGLIIQAGRAVVGRGRGFESFFNATRHDGT